MADIAISALPAQPPPVAGSDVLPLVEGGVTKKATVVDVVKGGGAVLKDGTVPFTGNQSLGGNKFTNSADASAATDLTTLQQVTALVLAGLATLALTGDVTSPAGTGVTTIAAGAVTTTKILDGNVTLAKLATQPALTVLANATNGTAAPTAVAAGADYNVFRRSGTALAFGSIDLSQPGAVGSSKLALGNLSDLAGLSVLGRSANTSGVTAAITGTDGQAFRVSGTVLGFGTLATAAYADNSVTLAKLATQAALSVLANATNATAVPSAVAAGTDGYVFLRSGTSLAFGQLAIGAFADGVITLAKLANGTALSVLGRSANSSGVYADMAAGTDGNIMRRSGTAIGFGSVDLSAAGAVGSSKLALANLVDLAGLSVLGRSTNSSGVTAAITGTADQVLCVNGAGTALAFSTVATGGIANNAVTLAKLATQAALTVLANGTNATAVPTAIAAASDGQVFLRSGTTLAFGTLAIGAFADGVITLAKLANGTALSVVGRSANTSGAYADMAAGTDGDVMRRSGTSISFGAPNFAAQNITTTGAISLGATPATAGAVRVNHNVVALAGRDNGNAANASLVRWGATANDKASFGSSSYASELLGSAVEIGDGTVYLEVASLATNREILSLLHGTALTTTEMPPNTGDKVAFFADATSMPTTGFPAGGGILGVDAGFGLTWKGKGGVETTIAHHGDSGNTTKRRVIAFKTRPLRTTGVTGGVQFTTASVDFTNVNGQAVTNAVVRVRARYLASAAGGGGYVGYGDYSGVFYVNGSSVPSNHGSGSLAAADNGSRGNDGGSQTFVLSGNQVQHKVTPGVTNTNTEYLAWLEIDVFEP